MTSAVKILLAILLSAISFAVFFYPQMMISPGHLISAHKSIENDCFACHSPWLGAVEERCTSCHKPAEIGKLTTSGLPVGQASPNPTLQAPKKIPFHQQLIDRDCMACHSDHTGVMRLKQSGHFNHSLLEPAVSNQCQSCHQAPMDSLHQKITDNCNQCHTQKQWKPSTFNHTKYFALDGDHNAQCETCHVKHDYTRYSCYGCHEHTPKNIREEHVEEGINNYDNCVECHRSGDEHDIRRTVDKNQLNHDEYRKNKTPFPNN